MVYSDKFVICVIVDGKPLKELANGCVPIKFGTQYSIRLRNKHSRRAVAKITIDGETISGGGIIVPANSYVDIHRRTDRDVAFKFVELDSPEAVDVGKNGPNPDKVKGTIQVSFFLERIPEPKIQEVHHYHPYPVYPIYPIYPTWPYTIYGSNGGGSSLSSSSLRSIGTSVPDTAMDSYSATVSNSIGASITADAPATTPLQDGCTAEGNATGQQFYTSYIDTECQSVTLTLFLQGFNEVPPRKTRKLKITEDAATIYNPKDKSLEALERENEELRKQLALIENDKLKKAIKRKSKKRVISE